MKVKNLILGSGPGGSMAAHVLASSGEEVLLLEEGPSFQNLEVTEHSAEQIQMAYRNGGLSSTWGRDSLTFAEGKALGGGSEINAGIFNRLPDRVLQDWQQEYSLLAATPRELNSYFDRLAQLLRVSDPGEFSGLSQRLALAAKERNWACEMASVFYQNRTKQTMSRTLLQLAAQNGAKIWPSFRGLSLKKSRDQWLVSIVSLKTNERSTIQADRVILAAGAIQTPLILRQSGIRTRIGNRLQCHPTVRVLAEFDSEVNNEGTLPPSAQVKEFMPRFGFGVSLSSRAPLRIALAQAGIRLEDFEEKRKRLGLFYITTASSSMGQVRRLPFSHDAFCRFSLSNPDFENLTEGLRELSQGLWAAQAKSITPIFENSCTQTDQGITLTKEDLQKKGIFSTLHLFATVPMGENKGLCPLDSFGRCRGLQNLLVCDASALCGPTWVNPQATIMAFAWKNIEHLLSTNGKDWPQ